MPYMESKRIKRMKRKRILGFVALAVGMSVIIGGSYYLLTMIKDQQNAIMQSKVRSRS